MMRHSASLFLLLLVGLFSLSVPTQAIDKIIFFLEDEPIYTSSSLKSPGFLLELSSTLMTIIGIEPDIQFMPWKRAQHTTIKTPNSVIFPLTRSELREDHYRWIFKVFEVPVMFINKKGEPLINSINDTSDIRGIGVISGTPQEEYLKQQGISYVSVSGNELYEKLAKGEFNVIYTAKPEALLAWKQGNYKYTLQYGKPLQTLPLWIAANKSSPLVDQKQWESALQATKDSGVFNQLRTKYFGTMHPK
jgi:hypothetical protein